MVLVPNSLRFVRCIRAIRQLYTVPTLSNPRGGFASRAAATQTGPLHVSQLKYRSLHQATPATAFNNSDARNDASPESEQKDDRMPSEKQEAWVEDKPTRAIASKLLNMPDHMAESHELYARVSPCGLFRSRRHFKHCVKILRAMGRVDMVCHEPSLTVSPTEENARSSNHSKGKRKAKLKFSIALTGSGRRVYSYYRRVANRRALQNTDPSFINTASSPSFSAPLVDSKTSGSSSPGLSNAL